MSITREQDQAVEAMAAKYGRATHESIPATTDVYVIGLTDDVERERERVRVDGVPVPRPTRAEAVAILQDREGIDHGQCDSASDEQIINAALAVTGLFPPLAPAEQTIPDALDKDGDAIRANLRDHIRDTYGEEVGHVDLAPVVLDGDFLGFQGLAYAPDGGGLQFVSNILTDGLIDDLDRVAEPHRGDPRPGDAVRLRNAYEQARELADGEAIEACSILLVAVRDFLGDDTHECRAPACATRIKGPQSMCDSCMERFSEATS